MPQEIRRQEAMELVGRAYQQQMRGEIQAAIDLYSQALERFPTAEAYTFRGWARSHLGDLEGAIADCHRAIDLDPEFGNPYNDIGAYHIELGRLDDAIPWLRMAFRAKRYESRCFPHYNLGRVYEAQGRLGLALEQYRASQSENPAYVLAAKAVARIRILLGSDESACGGGS